MKNTNIAPWPALLKRLVPAIAAMAAGIWILLRAGDISTRLLGLLFLWVAATAIARPLARRLARPAPPTSPAATRRSAAPRSSHRSR